MPVVYFDLKRDQYIFVTAKPECKPLVIASSTLRDHFKMHKECAVELMHYRFRDILGGIRTTWGNPHNLPPYRHGTLKECIEQVWQLEQYR